MWLRETEAGKGSRLKRILTISWAYPSSIRFLTRSRRARITAASALSPNSPRECAGLFTSGMTITLVVSLWKLHIPYKPVRDDLNRIYEQRLSPLRISLHTTDPCLRARLMGSPGQPCYGSPERVQTNGHRCPHPDCAYERSKQRG